ncbi:MAG: prepilin-type N-terminal cleavage/methylation domain-containing protein [Desulfitobacterium sp.]|nr:prepilin-type N-terminal cleavage/methylation domain-containing protein [Desulfitobacterium sp.]
MKLVIYQKNRRVNQDGFTLIEILLVVFIIAVLAAIALPRLGASSETARENADIATGHQLKSALDRYQIENGRYPKIDEAKIKDGKLEMEDFIPQYISKLDVSTTQQNTDADNRGFGIGTLEDGLIPEDNPTNLIMLYLTGDGSAAEVRVYNGELDKVLWSSLN